MSEITIKNVIAASSLNSDTGRTSTIDRRELERAYRQYWLELCKYVNKKFGPGPPDPEDVAQLAFARYAALSDPAKVENPRAYLYSAARNIVFDHYRKAKVAQSYADDITSQPELHGLEEITPEHVSIERDRLQVISAAILRLPEKQQVVLTLKRYHGATHAEIAARTGWSIADISRQLARAITTLSAVRDAMEEEPRSDPAE